MTTFAYELAPLVAAQEQLHAGKGEALYALPWYLLLGEPQSGRTTVLRSMNLTWPNGERPLQTNVPGQQCQYWLPDKAVFIEPGASVVGPARSPQTLMELCQELKVRRSREPLDGILLVLDARQLVDATEEGVERYAKSLRRYLVEVGQALDADVPTYAVLTGLDVLWGFGDAFQWTHDRVREDPWGFVLPPEVRGADIPTAVERELGGLFARMESTCFSKLSSEENIELRARAYQHLAELGDLFNKLREVFVMLTAQNAFERSPWLRALAVGSCLPGSGQQLRHRIAQFSSMGYLPPHQSGTAFPGGMPLHALIDRVLLPERELVGTAVRWRDDKVTLVLAGFALLGALAAAALKVAFVLSH